MLSKLNERRLSNNKYLCSYICVDDFLSTFTEVIGSTFEMGQYLKLLRHLEFLKLLCQLFEILYFSQVQSPTLFLILYPML